MTKRLLMAALLLLAPVCAYADGGCVHDIALQMRTAGLTVISGASIKVCTDASCNSLATIYTDDTLGITTSNPVTADTRGNYSYCATSGTYHEKITNSVDGTSYFKHYVSAVGTTALSALKSAKQDKGFVNGVTDCGVPSDTTTDICTTMQACLNNNPSKRIGLPDLSASITLGATPTPKSYYSTCRLTLNGNGQVIEGFGGVPNWAGGTVRIEFASGVGGARIPTTCYGCGLKNIELGGLDDWGMTTLTKWPDYPTLASLTGDGTDGLQLVGGSPQLDNVKVSQFGRHGILISGDSQISSSPAGQPDLWRLNNVYAHNNRGCGVYVVGGDSNAGYGPGIRAHSNFLGGICNRSSLLNTYVGMWTDSNSRSAISAGTTQSVTSSATSGGSLVITTAATPTNNTNVVGTWVTLTGSAMGGTPASQAVTSTSTDGLYKRIVTTAALDAAMVVGQTISLTGSTGSQDEICKISSVNTGAKLITCTTRQSAGAGTGGTITVDINQACKVTAANSSTITCRTDSSNSLSSTGGSVRTSASNEVHDATRGRGIPIGAYTSDDQAGPVLIVNGYDETGLQQAPDIGANTFLLGGNSLGRAGIWGRGAMGMGWANGQIVFYGKAGAKFQNNADQTQFVDVQCGLASDQQCTIRFLDKSGAVKWCMFKDSGGNIKMQTNCSASDGTILFLATGGVDIFPKSGQPLRFNSGFQAGLSGSTISDTREIVQSVHDCGTTTTCANTANLSEKVVRGTVALSSGTPSTAVVTAMTAFGGSTAQFYSCWLTNETTAANGVKYARTSSSSITITGPNTVTDVISYLCIGH